MSDDKPATTHNPEEEPPRRGFLRKAWLFLAGLALLQVLWIGVDQLRPRRRRRTETADGSVYTAGPVDRFEPGTVTAFPAGRFYLARLAEGGFLALSRTCTHLGCTVPWVKADQVFACPCHASTFDITGEVLGPPATRPLDLLDVRIENGIVKVDLSRVRRRREFLTAQVAVP